MEGIFLAGPGALILKLVDEAAFAHDVLSDMPTICGAFSNAVDSGRRRKAYAQGDNAGAEGGDVCPGCLMF